MSVKSSVEQRTRRTRRRLIAGLVLALLLLAAGWLQHAPLQPVEGYADLDVAVIAHAGAQGHAPPNTLEAFDAAVDLGADVLEMDLQITADGHVVTIHDSTVDATTDGTGAVADLTLAAFQALDAGAGWEDEDGDRPFAGTGVRHATLDEVLTRYPDTPLVIELKTDGGEAIIQPTIDLLEAHGRDDGSVTVASFDETYLVPVRDQLPDVPTNMPESETFGFYVRHLMGAHPWWSAPGEFFQVPEYFDDRLVVTSRFTRAAERLGVDVHVWTVNDPEQIHRMLDAGVHGIITDYPDRVIEVLDERAATQASAFGITSEEHADAYQAQLDRAQALQEDHGWARPLMRVITFLGDEEFYLLLLPIMYWAISRRHGTRLGVMLLTTASVNGTLKLAAATPRPGFFNPEVAAVSETSTGLPSGHAQNGLAIWGLAAASVRGWSLRIALVGLVLLIGLSRIYLGAHFFEDIWVGWLVGLALLAAFLLLERRFARWWSRVDTTERILASILAALVLIVPAVLTAGRLIGVGFNWPYLGDIEVAAASHVITPAATLGGFGVGVALLAARGGFDHRGPVMRRIVRVLVGLVGVVMLVEGLGVLLPTGEEPVALIARAVRYGAVGAWVGGVAPLLFVRWGLAKPAKRALAPEADGSLASQH